MYWLYVYLRCGRCCDFPHLEIARRYHEIATLRKLLEMAHASRDRAISVRDLAIHLRLAAAGACVVSFLLRH